MVPNHPNRSSLPAARILSRVAAGCRTAVAVSFGALAGMIVVVSIAVVPAIIVLAVATLIGGVVAASLAFSAILSLFVSVIGGLIWGGLRVRRRSHRDSPPVEDSRPVSVSEPMENVAICPNCGAKRQGKFCGTCGQNDRDYRRLFPSLSEVLVETFEADSRVWRTLRALLFRPGFLSLEFARDRRAHYISPFRLYLFASVPYFLITSYVDNPPQPSTMESAVADIDSATANLADQMSFDLLYEYLPVTVLLILPLYAFLLQFIFIGRRVYAESFVFVLHFMTIGFLILLVFVPWMTDYDATFWQYFAFFPLLGIYLFFALKRFYGAGFLATTVGCYAALSIFLVLFFVAVFGTQMVVGWLAGYELSTIFAEFP